MKSLVIVESPTKARTISKFLGKDYEIKASMGHVMDLPKSKLGVDVEHNFEPQYVVMPDKTQTLAELKKLAKSAKEIILATDPDREGEAIAAHIQEQLSGKGKGESEKFKRIVFHEITKEAVQHALENPGKVNQNLVGAQTARRVLDRLVGYKLSPLLWQKVRRGLSAGRVQSVALRLMVEREKEIEKFQKHPYFTITAHLQRESADPVEFELIEIKGKKIESQEKFALYDGEYSVTKTTIASEKEATDIVEDLKTKKYTVSDVSQKETKRSPQPPYTTSTLQQDASRRMGMPGKRTMSIAQKLYEEGHITYHRTDSVSIAASAQNAMASYIKKEYGEKYVPTQSRQFTGKQKLAQEAHEAIRPTKINVLGPSVSAELGPQYGKLYELIWRRALASQMSDAIIESTAVLVDAASENSVSQTVSGSANQSVRNSDLSDSPVHRNSESPSIPNYRFKANGSVLVFDGFLKINPFALGDKKLPQYQVGDNLVEKKVDAIPHETSSPPRYNDASLIKTLEEKGIGRPSTYASIISTIESRAYIVRDQGRFVPTPIGAAVTEFLVKNFPDIDDIPFTAEMEDSLDDVAHGKKEWEKEIKRFYGPFEKQLDNVKDHGQRVKIEVEELEEKCPDCKNPLVIRTGKFGKFISCSTFPECKYTRQYVEETGKDCPKDGGKIVVKKTRKGRQFYGCANYPNCDFAVWKLEDLNNK